VAAGEIDTGSLERWLRDGALDLAAPDDLVPAGAAALFLADTDGPSLRPGPWQRRFEGFGAVRIADGVLSLEGRSMSIEVEDLGDGRIILRLDGLSRTYAYAIEGEKVWIARAGHQIELAVERRTRDTAAALGSLEAPMPGKVLMIEAADGDRVEEGDLLLVLESMKMELQITAPGRGRVESLDLAVGDQVEQGQTLVAVTPVGEEEDR
jgi:biotin carboxyl carrier protein